MLQRSQRVLETIPVGSLGLIPLKSSQQLGQQVNDYLVKWRTNPILPLPVMNGILI